MKRLCLACFLIVACGTMPCCTNNSENSNKSTAGIVAQAGSVTVTTEDLTQALKGMPGPQQFEYLSDAGRRLLVDQLLDWKLLAAEAVKAELEDDTDVRDALKKNAATGIEKAQVLGSAYLNRRIKDLPRVTDGQLRAYFDANPLEFTLPARIQVQRMMLETSPQAQEALAAVRDGMSFEQYKQKYPESRIRIDSLWLEQRENGSDFEKAAFALSDSRPVDILEISNRFCLMRVEKKEPARVRAFEEVRQGIAAQLQDEQQRSAIQKIKAELRAGLDATVNAAALDTYQCAECEGRSPAPDVAGDAPAQTRRKESP